MARVQVDTQSQLFPWLLSLEPVMLGRRKALRTSPRCPDVSFCCPPPEGLQSAGSPRGLGGVKLPQEIPPARGKSGSFLCSSHVQNPTECAHCCCAGVYYPYLPLHRRKQTGPAVAKLIMTQTALNKCSKSSPSISQVFSRVATGHLGVTHPN